MMERVILLLFLHLFGGVCFADEYKDPVTNVIYTYDPAGDRAEVKAGEEWIDTDDGTQGYDYPGSPDAKGEIVILDRFTVAGKEYIVDRIGDCAFVRMSIMSIAIPSSVKSIGYKAFSECTSLSNVILSEGLNTIEMWAFYACTSLTTISLPKTLQKIELSAFSWCTRLRVITSLIENPFSVYNICLPNPSQVTLRVPAGTKSKYEATSGWNQFLFIEELPPTGIADFAPCKDAISQMPDYDLSGRSVPLHHSTHGIYIKNGKKVMVKNVLR